MRTAARPRRRGVRARDLVLAALLGSSLPIEHGALRTARADPSVALTPGSARDPVLGALREEVRRSLSLRLPGAPAPRLVLARMVEEQRAEVAASLGALLQRDDSRSRTLTVEVKVGDGPLDSGNVLAEGEPPVRSARVPFEDGTPALRRELWLLADASYKAAAAALEARRGRPGPTGRPPAWSDAAPSIAPPVPLPAAPDPEPLARLARDVSSVFRGIPGIEDARARIIAWSRRRVIVASDGTEVVDAGRLFLVTVALLSRASDGEPVLDQRSFAADTLPDRGYVLAEVERMLPEILALRAAPALGEWVGPVLFQGRAAPQLLEAVLASHLSGTPAPESLSGSTTDDNPLARRIGRRILPRGARLIDDPTTSVLEGIPLVGSYRWDDEGTPAQPVTLVDDGRLERLLLGRIPSFGQRSSNGHGRGSTGAAARGRAANLLLKTSAGLSLPALRRLALARAREEGTDQALEIELLDDGAITLELVPEDDRPVPDVPRPLVARRLRSDGTLELVRAGHVDGLGVRDLARMVALGAAPAVHSFLASGGLLAVRRSQHGELPTSIAAPAFLLGDVELRSEPAPLRRAPLTDAPPRSRPRAGSRLAGARARL